MAIDKKYGKVKIEGIPADEPVFILRAQDKLAFPIISRYANMADIAGCKPEFISAVRQVTIEFGEWAETNKTKKPD